MTELPVGTVTFLFTDIQGSTQLLEELGERYGGVQDEHTAILTKVFDDANGVLVRSQGDGLFVAFPDPVDAVRAAVSAQLGLAQHEWSHGSPLLVRMGLHTGRGVQEGGDYVSIDVNRAARISDAAHGGQVLLSEATKTLVEHNLPVSASLRDLGEHRLKGIRHPDRLYDLVIEGLPADFPPLRSLDINPNNLPIQLTSFVGRESELQDLAQLLGQTRILTLTGPGGIGKTRLALELAAECLTMFDDGVVFVDLSAVNDPNLISSEILGALEPTTTDARPVIERLRDHLANKELLLVVDNFEQVVDASPLVEELVSASPEVKAVVTSRVSLSLRGEQEYVVPPLQLPDIEHDARLLGESAAVRLFVDRARAITPEFELTEQNAEAVAEVVARLDGLPLAIELAATRMKVLTPQEMLDRLQDRLSLLTSGQRTLPERHQTLRAVIEWSYDLLDEAEQALLNRLAVFSGGWTLEAAEAVCAFPELGLDPLEGLASLVDRSLIVRRESDLGQRRFFMLETIREFAQEQLEARPDADVTRKRHALYFRGFALQAESHLDGRDLIEWMERCDREQDNIRAALLWAVDADDASLAQETAGALWRFWAHRGYYAEAQQWFDQVLAMASGQDRTRARAKALGGAGGIAWWQSGPEASGLYEEALDIEREHGDPKGVAEALYNWAFVAASKGDFDGAAASLNESLELFRLAGDELWVARVKSDLATQLAMDGQWDAAVLSIEETVETLRELGNPFQLGNAIGGLMVGYARTGRMTEARSVALEFLDLAVGAEDPAGIVATTLFISFLASWQGHYEECLQLAGASFSLREEAGAGPPPEVFEFLVGDPVGEARAKLSEDVAQRAWEVGQAMSQEEAVAMARAEVGGA